MRIGGYLFFAGEMIKVPDISELACSNDSCQGKWHDKTFVVQKQQYPITFRSFRRLYDDSEGTTVYSRGRALVKSESKNHNGANGSFAADVMLAVALPCLVVPISFFIAKSLQ